MTLKQDLDSALYDIARTDLDIRYGRVAPKTTDFNLSNEGVMLDATYLYVDMVGSSKVAEGFEKETAAKVFKAFLTTVTKVLLHYKGEIRSFDGDRVMAIFIGDDKSARAVRAAWTIRWAVQNLAYDKLSLYVDEVYDGSWLMKAGIGLDTGYALLVRGGVRSHNDIVSIGSSPNIAAKLSDVRTKDATYITEDVWDDLPFKMCFTDKGESKWSPSEWVNVGGRYANVRTSTYWIILND